MQTDASSNNPPRQTSLMAATLVDIDTESLRKQIEAGETFVLVDALSLISYAASHLPGAINMPPERVDDLAPRRIPDLDAEIVVYCAGPTCTSSVEVAERLVELGYGRVRHYSGGKRAWVDAGLPLEGGRA
jgi:rhodanese-related sulfurtransferase